MALPPKLIAIGNGKFLPEQQAAQFFVALNKAKDSGVNIVVNSANRTFDEQASLYNQLKGKQAVAKPGTSNHERGTAIDVQNWQEAKPYLEAAGYKWANHKNDPWHFDYVGNNKQPLTNSSLATASNLPKPLPLPKALPLPALPTINVNNMLSQLDSQQKYLDSQRAGFAQAASTPKANPVGSFLGGLAQGASANIYQAPAINPRDAGAQGAGAFVGSLAPIVAGGAIGGLPGAAIGGGLVAGGQDYRNQMNAIQAGKATGYNPLATAAQAVVGGALTPIPFANKGGPLRNLAINSGIGAIGGASGGITDKLINPQSQVTGQDILQQAGTGALFGGALGILSGRSPKPIEPVATPTRQPLMLTGGKATPALPPALERLQLTGGVVDPLQGGGVRLRPEANVVPDGGGIPVQGELLPPELEALQLPGGQAPLQLTGGVDRQPLQITGQTADVLPNNGGIRLRPNTYQTPTSQEPQVLQQAQQAFEANPATVLPDAPLSNVLDQNNPSIFMNKSAANQALKATGAPNDHVIVQDAGRYMVVPKGEPIPKAEPMFTRGQKVKVDGKDLTVINEPFGQVAVRLPDGNVRVVPREAITNQLDSLATQADQLAAFEARRAPVEAPTEPVQVSTFKRADGEIIPPKPVALPEQPLTPDITLPKFNSGFEKDAFYRDLKQKWFDSPEGQSNINAIKKDFPDFTDERIKSGGVPTKTLDEFWAKSQATTAEPLQTNLRPQVAETQAPPTNRLTQALSDSGFKSLDEAKVAGKSFARLRSYNPDEMASLLKKSGFNTMEEALQAKTAFSRLKSDSSIVAKGAEIGLSPEAARKAFTSLKGADDALWTQLNQHKNVTDRLLAQGGNMDDVQRLYKSYQATGPEARMLLGFEVDPATGMSKQQYGENIVPLAHESIADTVATLTPHQREIAQVLQRAIEQDKPTAETFRREGTGATSGTAGDYGSFTPIGFRKKGNGLYAEGYNENGHYAGRLINGTSAEQSGFNAVPRILEAQKPMSGPYANVTKELAPFHVDDIMNRAERTQGIKTSEIKAAIKKADDLVNNPDTPPRVKMFAQKLLDDPTPAGVNTAYRKLKAELQNHSDETLTKMMDDMGVRC